LAHVHCEDVFGIVGENVTFAVKIDQKIVEAVWMKNKDKVAEWEGHNKPKYFPTLQGRSVLQENGSLTILNLTQDDAGIYVLRYWDSRTEQYLNFKLDVLGPLPEPKISCNTSGDNLVLNCTADFERPLNYTLKLSNNPHIYQSQELPIPLENVDPTMKAACVIKFSQREKSSEISLVQCLP
ncbi:LFA3 protein, partial [Climacteris rufus]|nr:LFA3 protein [Climacteris rufus]